MCREHLYLAITTATKRALGAPVNPHMFRDALATSVALQDPEHVQIAAAMLGHATLATTNAYYNQAKMLSASERLQNVMSDLKATLKRTGTEPGSTEPLG